ncbi:cytochrome b [Advenella mimigardefordensis]|uniref:Putative cytochrome b561 n=1 Tax=Advenella mimigardefordensis (strain DSM 17166 / LMG 22922 / DPN7) TaxID=1247726 RepID=W0PDJ4_ADVMD|nr:cytochrome b [Advenella mimigardefordensis]AHG63532.1 putative cytochrome b561 [Advenella mimigardefordensis DPN7]
MDAPRYTRVAMALHWLVALCLIGQFVLGWYLEGIPRGVPDRSYFVNIHKSTGMLIGLLILLRIGWRLAHRPPVLPASVPDWQQKAASVIHFLLYFFMLMLPLTGYIASNFSKWGVKFFNTIEMPPWGMEDKAIYAFFNQLHGLISWILLGLIILHVLAAVSHFVSGHRDVIYRMLPGSSSGR